MTTELKEVFGGMNGYVPVKSNSHGGLDLLRVTNGVKVTQITSIPAEVGYVQLLKEDFWPPSETKEYWIELSHLKAVAPAPEPSGEWVAYDVKLEGGKLYLKKA